MERAFYRTLHDTLHDTEVCDGCGPNCQAAWLMQRWLAIHGGDPGPEGLRIAARERELATVRAITGLSRCLRDRRVERAMLEALEPAAVRARNERKEAPP